MKRCLKVLWEVRLAAKVVCTLLLLSTLPIQAYAEPIVNSLELPLGDIGLKPGTALKLKALALKASPEIDINNIQLIAIEVLTKSQQGKGMIRIRVGNKLTAWQKVSGTKETFSSKQADSFFSTKIRSPATGKGQVWQLLVNGYIKVRKIILYTTKVDSTPSGSI